MQPELDELEEGYRFRSFDFTTGLTIHTVPGYDNVTGIGTIDGVNFFK